MITTRIHSPRRGGTDLSTAAIGFGTELNDTRWTLGPADLALVDFLRAEQDAGRITTETRVLHIADNAAVAGDFNRFSVFTGIDDDPVVMQNDVWFSGGRVRQISPLAQALSEHSLYILEQTNPRRRSRTRPTAMWKSSIRVRYDSSAANHPESDTLRG